MAKKIIHTEEAINYFKEADKEDIIYSLNTNEGEILQCTNPRRKIDITQELVVEGIYVPYFVDYLNISELVTNEAKRASCEMEYFERGFRDFQWENKIIGKSAQEVFDGLPKVNLYYLGGGVLWLICIVSFILVVNLPDSEASSFLVVLCIISLFAGTFMGGYFGDNFNQNILRYKNTIQEEPIALEDIHKILKEFKEAILKQEEEEKARFKIYYEEMKEKEKEK